MFNFMTRTRTDRESRKAEDGIAKVVGINKELFLH
jgi:hypothetical protein